MNVQDTRFFRQARVSALGRFKNKSFFNGSRELVFPRVVQSPLHFPSYLLSTSLFIAFGDGIFCGEQMEGRSKTTLVTVKN